MRRHTIAASALAWSLGWLAGCGGPAATDDGGARDDAALGTDAATSTDAGPASDAGPLPDAGSSPDAGAACTPTAGAEALEGYCDSLELAVLAHDGAPSELVLSGRVFASGGGPSCVVVEGVDIVESSASSAVVQHLPGGRSFALDSGEHEIARGVPEAAVTELCTSDDPARRFEVYGVVVRGRVDGGTFEAHCARAEGGSRWPPALRVTCHRNVDASPFGGSVMVTSASFMGTPYQSSRLGGAARHGPGGALTSVDGTIHVIPRRSIFDPGAPIAPFDSTGWMGSANESGTTPAYSQLQAFASTVQFDLELCPPPSTGVPGPGYVPPPAFLARLTGSGEHGPYTTELFVNGCYTTSGP